MNLSCKPFITNVKNEDTEQYTLSHGVCLNISVLDSSQSQKLQTG